MANFSHGASARLQVEFGLYEELLWQWIYPKFACHFDRKNVLLDRNLYPKGSAVNAWFKHRQGIKQLRFNFVNARGQAPVELADSEVQNRAKRLFVIAESQLTRFFLGEMPNRVK